MSVDGACGCSTRGLCLILADGLSSSPQLHALKRDRFYDARAIFVEVLGFDVEGRTL